LAHRQKGGAMKRERQQSTYEAGRRWPAPCLPSGCASFLLRVFAVKEGAKGRVGLTGAHCARTAGIGAR
jgi:hypothetical protein